MLFQKINDDSKKITGDQLIILNEEVKSFTDICGACERIKNYPLFLQRFP
jgi:putative membrane protein